MATFPRRLALLGAAAVAVPLLAALPIGSASAASKTVTIGSSAFSPASLTIAPKDSVAFTNGTGTLVSLSYSSNWPGSATETLAPGATSTRRTLTAVGTYTASATGIGVSSSGKVVVKKPVVTSTGTPTPRATRSSPPPSPRPTATQSTASPSAQPTPSTGVAPGPAIGPSASFGPQPTGSAGPQPSVAPPPSDDPPALAGRSKTALLQPHAVRRLGLPGAVSVVLVLGLLFGIARVLLAMAPRRPQAD